MACVFEKEKHKIEIMKLTHDEKQVITVYNHFSK